ncbi:hypothetical protein [Streptomyces acidicola]|uniref:hypothetical protein n=1 Tax=Streptomyces acidicola TaxID=2596892 RepID=UPI00381DF84C
MARFAKSQCRPRRVRTRCTTTTDRAPIAANIERLSGRDPRAPVLSARPPTAFQTYLDQNDFPRSKSWRTPSS